MKSKNLDRLAVVLVVLGMVEAYLNVRWIAVTLCITGAVILLCSTE